MMLSSTPSFRTLKVLLPYSDSNICLHSCPHMLVLAGGCFTLLHCSRDPAFMYQTPMFDASVENSDGDIEQQMWHAGESA